MEPLRSESDRCLSRNVLSPAVTEKQKKSVMKLIPRVLGRWMARHVNGWLEPYGLEILKKSQTRDQLGEMLIKLGNVIQTPASFVDLGAARGEWTCKFLQYFPEVKTLMVEPLDEHQERLEAICGAFPRVQWEKAAIGATDGTVDLSLAPDLDGSGIYGGDDLPKRRVVMRSLDSLVSEKGLEGPFLIKCDTHGFELPILHGAENVIRESLALIIECYNFQISPTAIPFWEMCKEMENRGFRPFDLSGMMWRPGDGAFWQMDILFLRSDASVFRRNTYQASEKSC